jgi:hypothetical protein
LEKVDFDGRTILKRTLRKRMGCGLVEFGSGSGRVAGCFGHGNETSSSI